MIRVALTGGIGSGKSEVARVLRDRGAVVIDADEIAREIVRPGEPALAEVVREFGPGILRDDGTLDRPALAAIVFHDPERLAALNRIMHPRIGARAAERIAHARAQVVVYDMPLLVEQGLAKGWDHVVVVQAPEPVRLRRLEARGVDHEDARARMAAQASDEERRAVADTVIDNGGSLQDLRRAVEALWERLAGFRPDSGGA